MAGQASTRYQVPYAQFLFSTLKERRAARRQRALWLWRAGRWSRLRKYYSKYYKRFRASSRRRKRQKRSGGPGECRACRLLLVADPSFYREVGERSVRQTVLQLLHHVRETNLLLRQQETEDITWTRLMHKK